MTAANNLDEILGPEPTVEQVSQEVAAEPVVEQAPTEIVAEPVVPEATPIENKQTPEQIAENYKRMAHAERMERKQMQEQMKIMQQRFEQLTAAMQPAPTPEPEFTDDPLAATHVKVEKVAQSIEQLRAEAEQRKHHESYQNFVRQIQSDEASFMQKVPDYKDAISFIQHRRIAELEAMGHDEQTIRGVIAQDALQLTQRAMQLGESPAKFGYDLAKKLGYAGKPQGNIDQIAAGQQVAKSVAGGAQPVSDGSLPENLAEMNDAEFAALLAKYEKAMK
jgi:hypothetical protein